MEERHKGAREQANCELEIEELSRKNGYKVPDVSVVRTSTPRPMPFDIVPPRTQLPIQPSSATHSFSSGAPGVPPDIVSTRIQVPIPSASVTHSFSSETPGILPDAVSIKAQIPAPLSSVIHSFSAGISGNSLDPVSTTTRLSLPPSGTTRSFPVEAPVAPPLPEESENRIPVDRETPRPNPDLISRSLTDEFVWLFEYALDMDPLQLNRPERLDGSAFVYGPALVKGYRLAFEGLDSHADHVIASLTPAEGLADAVVWGVLYRVPRRFARSTPGEHSLLNRVHLAETFTAIEIQVYEPYRQRELTCITYVASESTRQKVRLFPAEKRFPEPAYLRRLLQIARRQKLPASYVHTLEELLPVSLPAAFPLPTTPPDQETELALSSMRQSHTLTGKSDQSRLPRLSSFTQDASLWDASYPPRIERWLTSFSLYIGLLLLGTFVLITFQGLGFGREIFNDAFAPLGVPWYVFVYSLLGGCTSCVISLGRPSATYPPVFVILTWFLRPLLGTLPGAFVYLFLNSGLILISTQPAHHFMLSALTSILAGFCERWLFSRKSHLSIPHWPQ